jgi:hypothetical protein
MCGGSISSSVEGQSLLVAGPAGQNGFDEFVANYQDGLVHSFMLRQVFEEGVRRNCRIAGDGVALPDVKHYSQSRVRGARDVVDGLKTLLRRPGGLIG